MNSSKGPVNNRLLFRKKAIVLLLNIKMECILDRYHTVSQFPLI